MICSHLPVRFCTSHTANRALQEVMQVIQIACLATVSVVALAMPGKRFAISKGPLQCGRRLNRQACPLFEFQSDLVTKDEFIAKVMSQSSGWMTLNSLELEFDSPIQYGKCMTRWNPPYSDDIFIKQEVCYNHITNKCDALNEVMRITEDECGRVRLIGVNGSSSETFHSQDLDKYIWRNLCFKQTAEYTCSGGRFVDLKVKRERSLNSPNRAVDITGLPWDLISADMRNVYRKDISDPDIRNSFLGPECDFL